MGINQMKKQFKILDVLLEQKSKELEAFLISFESKYSEIKKLRRELTTLKFLVAKDKRNKCKAYRTVPTRYGSKFSCLLRKSENQWHSPSITKLCSNCEYTKGEIATRLLAQKLKGRRRK